MHQGCENDARQPIPLARTDAGQRRIQAQSPAHQGDDPEQSDETERDLYRKSEVGSRLRGVRVSRVWYIELHGATEYPSASFGATA